MKTRAIIYGCAAAYGLALAALRLPLWVLVPAIVVPIALQQLYCRVIVGARMRGKLLKLVDPVAGPPEGSYPVESEIPRRLDEANDPQALAALLADDFGMTDARGRRIDRQTYIKLDDVHEEARPGVRRPASKRLSGTRSIPA